MRPASKHQINSYVRPFLASAMIAGGLLQLAAPIYAAGTAANQDISNTATASYEDPTGATLNTTSNTVTVKVAEVAGITITAGNVINVGSTGIVGTTLVQTGTGVAPVANDKLVFEFDLTNIGNDTTSFKVPNQAQVGSSPVTVNEVQYYDFATTSWKPVNSVNNIISKNSTDGTEILPTGIAGNTNNTKSIVKVRVLATVNAGTTSGAINVTLGNTGQTNLQNAPFAATGGDVYTVDNADGSTGESAGAPSNGEREAAATAVSAVNPEKQAFVAVKKTAGTVNTKGTPAIITDDEVTYKLSMDVAATAPSGTNKAADDLAGTPIKLEGNIVNKVLVSDAIPVGTKLVAAPAPSDTTWTVVYTDAAIGTATANDSTVAWKTLTVATPLNTVTRIGYVKNGPIAKGTSFPDFAQLTVVFSGIPTTGASVLNIAQAFGTTVDANGNPDITKPAVDESGDAQYNNLNSDGTPGPAPTNGVATSADGVDTAGNNTGSGFGGEDTIVTVTPAGQATGLTNGPLNTPDATGPSGGKNDDFTNKSVTIDTTQAKWTNGVPNAVDPQSIGFTNTVKSTGSTRPDFVSLLPTAPANPTDLPDGTSVKIVGTGGAFVEYTYTSAGGFTPKVAGTLPLTLTVPVGGSVNYGVEIDLPAGTPQLKGFPVSITAFANGQPAVLADPNTGLGALAAVPGNNVIDPTDAQNITIDRVYTGYVKLLKEAQVSKIVNGVTSVVYPFAASVPKAEPGQYIEYRIKYTNISEEVPAGSGSIGLAANNIKIVEDGNIGTNNWASLTDHKPNSAIDNLGTILYESGAKTPGDLIIGDYLDTVPTIPPTKFGQFSFTRQVK